MSTHVYGIRPPDEQFQRYKAVWEACTEAGIAPPDAVQEFFCWVKVPDFDGVHVELDESSLQPWSNDHEQGFQVDILGLPKDVTVVRFVNSW